MAAPGFKCHQVCFVYPGIGVRLNSLEYWWVSSKKKPRKKRGLTCIRNNLFPGVLALLREMVAIFEAIAFLAAYAIHRATETKG